MSSEPARPDDRKEVMLEGDLTINSVEKIQAVFVDSLKDASEVIVSFGKIANVDLTSLQLLCAVHRSASRAHKHVRFEGGLPQILKDTAGVAGFLRQAGCKVDCGKNCFWTIAPGDPRE